MRVDAIQTGIVIDHITAGRGMQLYHLLWMESLGCPVALMMTAVSGKMGRKDIIKIDAEIPVDIDVIGYVDPGATVNFIRDGALVEKRNIEMPKMLTNVIRCKNPRCITSVETGAEDEFYLADRERKIYRCRYCDTAYSK